MKITEKSTFEEFLEEIAPANVHTNNSPEGFETWLEQLDSQEIMDFAESYGRMKYLQGKIDAVNEKNLLAENIN